MLSSYRAPSTKTSRRLWRAPQETPEAPPARLRDDVSGRLERGHRTHLRFRRLFSGSSARSSASIGSAASIGASALSASALRRASASASACARASSSANSRVSRSSGVSATFEASMGGREVGVAGAGDGAGAGTGAGSFRGDGAFASSSRASIVVPLPRPSSPARSASSRAASPAASSAFSASCANPSPCFLTTSFALSALLFPG